MLVYEQDDRLMSTIDLLEIKTFFILVGLVCLEIVLDNGTNQANELHIDVFKKLWLPDFFHFCF